MLKFGNKEFRNLQEQVLKNMLDIRDIMQGATVLAEFGIKIIGQVDTAEELPDPSTYEGEYGDAYIVGTEEPYEYYIFTRAFEGQDEPSWFDLGIFPVPGPQGETGPQGPQGPQGQTGNPGATGTSAGFGTISATAQTLVPGSSATATVSASGPDTAKNFAFTFGIPQGEQGSAAECVWGLISGDLEDQTDLANALQAKQDSLVSGTNIKTINNESILGSGNLAITAGVSDVEVNGTSVVTAGVAEIDLTGYATTSDISDMATETWVGNQGYLTSVSWSDVSGKPTFATVATSGDYDDLLNKPTIPAAQVQSNWTEADNTKVDYIKNKPTLATVATSGDYGDLLNKPTIPAAQVNSDWDAVSGVAQILNKPSLATVATSGSYADLSNKPTIPSVSGTYSGSNWSTITIDGTTKNISGGVTDVEVDNVSVVTSGVAELSTETWTFTLSDNTTVTKKVLVG